MRMSGPMRTAIIPLATCSPQRTPASQRHASSTAPSTPPPLRNDVGQPIVDDDFDFDVGILRQELRKLRQQDRVGGIFGGCDPNRTGWLLPKLPYGRKLGFDLLEPR